MAVNLGSAYGEIVISTDKAESNVQSLSSKLMGVGAKMSAAITAPLTGIAVAGIKATMAFSQSMNTLQTVSGATGAAMERIQATALQLGKDTSFSANEAAQGMLELAKAGFTAEQTIAAIPGVLNLAAAGELAVGQAAEVAANAINAFNLPASESGRIADILAASANASSVEVTDLAQSMNQAGAVFATNKQSVETLAAAIGILGNNGIKGSDAGTSLKTAMMRLTAPTGEAADVMKELGIQVYNADGSIRDFRDILGSVEQATNGMTDAQRNQALTTLFGADAIRAMSILLKEGTAGFDEMKAAVTQAGAAQEVADSKMRGLAGAIKYAQGTIESTMIAAFLPLEDMAARLVRGFADLVGKFVDLPAPVRNAAMAFAAVLAAAGPLMLAIPAIGAVLGALLSPIGLIAVALAALAAAWAADWGGIRKKTTDTLNAIQDRIKPVIDWLRRFGDAVGNLLAGREFADLMSRVRSSFQNIAEAVRGFFSGSLSFDGLRSALTDGMQRIGEAVRAFFGGASFGEFLTAINWSDFIARLSDWGAYITAIDWGSYITKLVSWGAYITKLVWSDVLSLGQFLWSEYISKIDWKSYIPNLTWSGFVVKMVSWSAFVTALIWNTFVSVLNWGMYVNHIVWTDFVPSINWRAVVGFIIWGEYIKAITWQNYIAPLIWDTYIKYVEWTNYIKQLFWEMLIPRLNWPDFASHLTWGEFVAALDWGAFVPLLQWGAWLAKLFWPDFIPALNWAAWISNLVWSTFVPKLSWSTFAKVLTWSSFVARLSWSAYIPSFSWGSFIGRVNLSAYVPRFSWGSFISGVNLSAYVPRFPGWAAFVGSITGNAVGTTFFEGGATLVGERGPELLTLPRGSRIDTAHKTRGIMQGAQAAANMSVELVQNFYGSADAATVRRGADSGLRDAAFALGVNLA